MVNLPALPMALPRSPLAKPSPPASAPPVLKKNTSNTFKPPPNSSAASFSGKISTRVINCRSCRKKSRPAYHHQLPLRLHQAKPPLRKSHLQGTAYPTNASPKIRSKGKSIPMTTNLKPPNQMRRKEFRVAILVKAFELGKIQAERHLKRSRSTLGMYSHSCGTQVPHYLATRVVVCF